MQNLNKSMKKINPLELSKISEDFNELTLEEDHTKNVTILDIDLNSLGLSYQALKDFLEKNTFQKNNYCYKNKKEKI